MSNQNVIGLNYNEMKSLFLSVETNTFINLKYEVVVGMNKTNNPYYNEVTKLVSGNFLIGNEYGKRVGSNGRKEGIIEEFIPLNPKGKHHISLCVLEKDTDHNVHYLSYEYFEGVKPQVEYFHNEQTIERSLFQSFETKKSESSRQPQEKKVNWRTLTLSNIKEFTLNGQRYKYNEVEELVTI